MTSCILLPRSCFALCSPSVQRMASATFDLPQPFGPIMAVTPCWKGISTLSANDLKPRSSIFSSFIEFPLKQIFNIIPYTRGGHKRKRKCFTKSAKHQTFVKHTPKSKKNPLDKRISGDTLGGRTVYFLFFSEIPTRASSAARCSASRLLPPFPMPHFFPPTVTEHTNTGAWGAPSLASSA